MATAMVGFSRSYVAAADLSSSQYHIVELTGNDQCNVCNNAGDQPIGILQNDPGSGQAATVWSNFGVSKVVSDGSGTAIARGDLLGTNASGRAVKKAADADRVIGIALDASTANGTIIRVELLPFQRAS